MKSTKTIPQYEPLFNRKRLKQLMNEYLSTDGWMTEHKLTKQFEDLLAKELGVKYCHVVNNGTISLSLALLAMGVKAGDIVLVPTLSMIATASAVSFIGAKPKFVEINTNLCMNYSDTVIAIKKYKPKAVLFVSLNGRVGDGIKIEAYCRKRKIALIEDAAQSFGSDTTNAKIKSYSFSMPKIITTGQGGALVTNNEKISKIIRHLKDFGRETGGNDKHDYYGINSKFTELQAVLGIEQMDNIKQRIKRKKEIYSLYKKELNEVVNFVTTDLNKVTPWFIDIIAEKRDELIEYLKKEDINTRKIYPSMCSQKIYKIKKKYPITTYYTNRGLWLPSSLTLSDNQIRYICNKIKEFYGKV